MFSPPVEMFDQLHIHDGVTHGFPLRVNVSSSRSYLFATQFNDLQRLYTGFIFRMSPSLTILMRSTYGEVFMEPSAHQNVEKIQRRYPENWERGPKKSYISTFPHIVSNLSLDQSISWEKEGGGQPQHREDVTWEPWRAVARRGEDDMSHSQRRRSDGSRNWLTPILFRKLTFSRSHIS